MVGIFSRFQVYRRSQRRSTTTSIILFLLLDRKETPFSSRDEIIKSGSNLIHGLGEPDSAEFEPIDHPAEPLDEDRPVKCPMPDSSVLNDEGMMNEELAESLWKMAELSSMNEEGLVVVTTEPPAQAVRKRQHTLTRDRAIPLPSLFSDPPLPTLSTQSTLQVLQRSMSSNLKNI